MLIAWTYDIRINVSKTFFINLKFFLYVLVFCYAFISKFEAITWLIWKVCPCSVLKRV